MSLALTYFYSTFRNLGGVEAVLHHHYAQDARWSINSKFVIYFESATPPVPRVHFLALDGTSSLQTVKKGMKLAHKTGPTEVAVYHGAWGLNFLAAQDLAGRRILTLHGESPQTIRELQRCGRWLDGVLCVSHPVRRLVERQLPHLADGRIGVVSCPISPPATTWVHPPLAGRELVLGYCGRLVEEQKRVSRFLDLSQALDKAGITYRFEFLGDGPARSSLEEALPNRTRFRFHGRLTGDAYWEALRQWDAIVFVSDYEGIPLSLLEGLSMGVVPVYPRIQCGGQEYIESIRPSLLYPPGNIDEMVKIVAELTRLTDAALTDLRQRCRAAVAPHLHDGYMNAFAKFVGQIRAAPPVATTRFPWRPFPLDRLSFETFTKLSGLRQRVRGWTRSK